MNYVKSCLFFICMGTFVQSNGMEAIESVAKHQYVNLYSVDKEIISQKDVHDVLMGLQRRLLSDVMKENNFMIFSIDQGKVSSYSNYIERLSLQEKTDLRFEIIKSLNVVGLVKHYRAYANNDDFKQFAAELRRIYALNRAADNQELNNSRPDVMYNGRMVNFMNEIIRSDMQGITVNDFYTMVEKAKIVYRLGDTNDTRYNYFKSTLQHIFNNKIQQLQDLNNQDTLIDSSFGDIQLNQNNIPGLELVSRDSSSSESCDESRFYIPTDGFDNRAKEGQNYLTESSLLIARDQDADSCCCSCTIL